MGLIVVGEHLIIDPICTLLFGDTECYRMRGYFYNSRIAELYKKAD
jgi:hypothetical protein